MKAAATWVPVLLFTAFLAGCGNSAGFHPDGGNDAGGGVDATDAMRPQDGSSGMDVPSFGNDASDASDAADSGPPVCDPSCVAAGGKCSAGVCTLTENPAGVSASTKAQLKAGGTSDSGFVWIYPYDKTVFPRGLVSPTLQFDGQNAADAVWIHVSLPWMTYDGYLSATAASSGLSGLQVQIPPLSWAAITDAARGSDTLEISATKVTGGMITGPVTESWKVAPGSIRGTIYYETYNSAILSSQPGVMRIDPGATTPTPLFGKSGACGPVCHTASANGSTLVAENESAGGPSATYDLKTAASVIYNSSNQDFTYCGLYPDGTFCMSATNYRGWYNGASRLLDTKTGASIPMKGWTVTNAGTVMFSPDGKHIAFNHEDTGAGHTLATMDFDKAGYTFSKLVDVATDPTAILAWPSFTPDETTLAYHAGSNNEFETDSDATGDIFLVDLATKKVVRADALDGYSAPKPSTKSYLPANDPALNFAPTILPEAVGGYFWVVFTSHRSYGNTLASKAGGDVEGQLWVAALDIGAPAGTDSSHPAFYLDGQETTADNLRGYWVLPPCKNNGQSCTSGDECCGGYCRAGSCVGMSSGCAHEYEKCTVSSDCCDPGEQCIGGFCAQATPK